MLSLTVLAHCWETKSLLLKPQSQQNKDHEHQESRESANLEDWQVKCIFLKDKTNNNSNKQNQTKPQTKPTSWKERVFWEIYQLLEDSVLRPLQQIISVQTKFGKNGRRQVSLCEEFFKDAEVKVVHHCEIHCRVENTAIFLFSILRWNERSNYLRDQTKYIICHFIKHQCF